MSDAKPKAVGYTRVSTAQQANEGYSLEAQKAMIRAACQQRGLELLHVFSDAGLSGGSMERPGLSAAVELCCQMKATLVFHSISRLSRSVMDALTITGRLGDAGAHFISLTESIDTSSPHGKMLFACLAAFAQLEREMISQRTRDGKARKRLEHPHLYAGGGVAPYGYMLKANPDTGKRDWLVACGPEKEVVAFMREYYDLTKSVHKVAEALNIKAFPTRSGKGKWHPCTVKRILDREARCIDEQGEDLFEMALKLEVPHEQNQR